MVRASTKTKTIVTLKLTVCEVDYLNRLTQNCLLNTSGYDPKDIEPEADKDMREAIFVALREVS